MQAYGRPPDMSVMGKGVCKTRFWLEDPNIFICPTGVQMLV